MIDYSLLTYNLVSFFLSLITGVIILRILNWIYYLRLREIKSLKQKVRLLFSHVALTKTRYLQILAEEVISSDMDKEDQVLDLIEQYDDDETDLIINVAKDLE